MQTLSDLFSSRNQGFTLLELVLVMALFFIVLGIAVPYGFRFFNVERLDGASRDILENLRLAQAQAASQNLDSDFGVYIGATTFTLFKGASYASRDQSYDQVSYLSSNIGLEGIQEIVFQKLSGLPKAIGEIIFTSGDRANVIRINAQGLISLDLNVAIGTP